MSISCIGPLHGHDEHSLEDFFLFSEDRTPNPVLKRVQNSTQNNCLASSVLSSTRAVETFASLWFDLWQRAKTISIAYIIRIYFCL